MMTEKGQLREKVLLLLRDSGRTQKDFAEAIGLSPQTLNGWIKKNRDPTAEYIIPICLFFGISPNELLEYGKGLLEQDDDERELLEHFRTLGKVGRRAVLAEVDEQLYRQRLEGDNSKTATS